MNYISVCSGIEAATVAWHHMGWKPLSFSEISKYPSAVLQHHYPMVPNVGDMTKYKGWNYESKPNLLVGGTPCQSFSVAGLRKGLSDPHGNLMLIYLGILEHFQPEWFIWENVPGVLSSQGGRDFSCFLTGLGELGYGYAWRVFNARYFGSACERRRTFVVGHRSGNFHHPANVLFDSRHLERNISLSKEEWCGHILASRGLDSTVHSPIRYFKSRLFYKTTYGSQYLDNVEKTFTLTTGSQPIIAYEENGQVIFRKMTPIELERVMGFPDDYTKIPWGKKDSEHTSLRIHTLGNSMSVPVMRWIGERVNTVHNTILNNSQHKD